MSDKPKLKAKDAPDLGKFDWEDPFRLNDQLTEEERMLRDAARAYAQDKLLPVANLNEGFTNAESNEDLGFAYFQSYLVVDYIATQRGTDAKKLRAQIDSNQKAATAAQSDQDCKRPRHQKNPVDGGVEPVIALVRVTT